METGDNVTPSVAWEECFDVCVDEGVCIPTKAHDDDAAFDLIALDFTPAGSKERIHMDFQLDPGSWVLANTGVRIALKPGWEAQIRSRSGLALKQGLIVLNSPGTIDAGYRNYIGVILYNASENPIIIATGQRVAQMVIKRVPNIHLRVVTEEEFDVDTERGTNGYGSSGV